MPEYCHTLIPEHVDFVPDPKQIASFLSSLVAVSAAPLEPKISLSKLSGEVRSVMNPFTGETSSMPMRKVDKLMDLTAIPAALKQTDDYDLTLAGKGPPKLPAFKFDFKGEYDFLIHCCLRAEVVSTSDWHDDVPIEQKVEFFGRPCNPKDRLGIFHNPSTREVIEVPKAGCARFWIEFEFGKMLFPPIKNRLDLIEPKIVEVAEAGFGIKFVQGCHWCA
jgi:hypothetical protein